MALAAVLVIGPRTGRFRDGVNANPFPAGNLPLAMVARANAALCAESAGALEALMALTVEHLRTRRQFGKPLAGFQAIHHIIKLGGQFLPHFAAHLLHHLPERLRIVLQPFQPGAQFVQGEKRFPPKHLARLFCAQVLMTNFIADFVADIRL